MLIFSEIQQYLSKRYNLNATTAAETAKQIIADCNEWHYTQHQSQKCLADIGEYCDYLESLGN